MFAGRIHSALVSKVNAAARSVTVEWYERGETKGKEVELDAIMQLNAELERAGAGAGGADGGGGGGGSGSSGGSSQPKITKQSSSSASGMQAPMYQPQTAANPLSRVSVMCVVCVCEGV